MRYRHILVILPSLLMLAPLPACSTIETVRDVAALATSPVPLGDFTVLDDKAMFAAEAVYNVPAQAYVSANSRGLVKPPLKATLKPMLVAMGDTLRLCRTAYKIGDLTSFNQRYAGLMVLKSQVMHLIPKG